MMGGQRDREQRMFPNGVIIVARWPATAGRGGFDKDGKYHTFCSSKCRSDYIQKGPKPLQVKLTMFFELLIIKQVIYRIKLFHTHFADGSAWPAGK